jgi:hypothetical protein
VVIDASLSIEEQQAQMRRLCWHRWRAQRRRGFVNGRFEYYGETAGFPEVDLGELKGKLIVIEGTDGVRTVDSHGLLKQWLEHNGHACSIPA